VITFNYDLLVEIAHAVFTNFALALMYSVPVTFMNARANMVFGREKTDEGLRLLKMHGSLNWRYSGPGGPAGDLVYEVGYESTGHSAATNLDLCGVPNHRATSQPRSHRDRWRTDHSTSDRGG
jgi:hypothetical protein